MVDESKTGLGAEAGDDGAAGAEVPSAKRRAVLKAAASAPVILTLVSRTAHARYWGEGETVYEPYFCEVDRRNGVPTDPQDCLHPPPME